MKGNYRLDLLEHKEEILQWIQQGESNAEIARRLNCKVDTLKSYYKKMNIIYGGNQFMKGKKFAKNKLPIELFVASNASNSRKRIRLIESGIKQNKCEYCGLSTWMGKKMPLELHHKDFNHYNNSLDNLEILCPNCHMIKHNYYNYKKPGSMVKMVDTTELESIA